MKEKKTVRPAVASVSAAALIAKSNARANVNTPPDPPAAALAELRQIVEHNDGATWRARVGAEDVIALLSAHGWAGKSRTALDSLCKKTLGRKSFGTP